MIIVNCGLRQDDIIEIVENIEVENEKIFKYVKKKGIRIFFECTLSDIERACYIANRTISNTKYGKALFYNVVDKNTYFWLD